MSVEVHGTIVPKNGGDFPVTTTQYINHTDGTKISNVIDDHTTSIADNTKQISDIVTNTTADVKEENLTVLPSTWTLGGLGSDGSETTATDRYRTGFIDVRNLEKIKLEGNKSMYRINLYDVTQKFLRQASFEIAEYVVASDVSYIKILVMGTTKTSYIVYSSEYVKTGTASVFINNAIKYNFQPTNDATTNTTALQNAVNAGGTVIVDKVGTYDINDTIKIGDNVTLVFGAGVYIRRASSNGYVFINSGAYTKTYNENISIKGLKLICNGFESLNGTNIIKGLRGQIAFFYVKNLKIENFECLDVLTNSYAVHICTFENINLDTIKIEGKKDAVHLGRGTQFTIRNGYFKTYDDPIALNAHDYDTGNPELGWIENGIIENCHDLSDTNTTGYFCRILAGSWLDWYSGMVVQKSDTVVSGGRLYRVFAAADGTQYTSTTQPTHTSGSATLDGITWVMIQSDVTYNAGCRNIHFKNIYLQKNRSTAFCIAFDKDNYSRSYYPNSIAPIQKDLIFENIFFQATIPVLISSLSPINVIKIVNCVMDNSKINLLNIGTTGITYNNTAMVMSNTTFKGTGSNELIYCDSGRTATAKILGSVKEDDTFTATFSTGVTVSSNDI